jgi:heptosyltransferase-2
MTRILVVLPNWFGETLFATPFLRLLHAQEPEAQLTALGRPACRDMLRNHPAIHEMIELPEAGLARRASLLGVLRRRKFDTAYILRRSLSRTVLLLMAGIPERIGFDNAKSGWLLTRRIAPASPMVHKALAYLPLLGVNGAPVSGFDYTVSEDERREARALLQKAVPGQGPLVMLHPGANWPHKRWPPERVAELGDRLASACGARIVITGSPDDRALAEGIRSRIPAPSTVLAGKTTVRQLAACLEQAQLLVSNDTGILHIAAALRRPLVALYGPTSPLLTGPLGDTSRMRVLHHQDCCPTIPCMRPGREPGHAGMASISVDEAFAAARELLGHGTGDLGHEAAAS